VKRISAGRAYPADCKRRLEVRCALTVTLTITLGLFVSWAPTAAEQLAVSRNGVMEVATVEVASLVATITKDPRFEALRRVVEERGFTLAPDRGAGRDFPEGYRAIFVPALDSEGKEQGFLVTSEEVWALSLNLGVGTLLVCGLNECRNALV
jgi:hypothetical protein